jgi:Ca2+-binding EF-hand superfamily protein
MNKFRHTVLVVGSSVALAGSVFAGTALAGGDGGCGGEAKGAHGPAARFAELDTNKDAKVTLAELTAAREGWLARVDANKDGVASSEELEAGFAGHRKERLEKLFTEQDQNKDGRLARSESHMPSAWFERADQNRDGALTPQELSGALDKVKPGRGGAPGRDGKSFHGRFDDNGDGKVDRAEVQKAAARQLARLDRNADGSLTSDEFRAGRGHGHGRHRHGQEQKTAPKPNTPAPTAS